MANGKKEPVISAEREIRYLEDAMSAAWPSWEALKNAVRKECPERADELLEQLADDPEKLKAMVAIVIGKKAVKRSSVKTITVPDISAKKLLAATEAQADLTDVDPDYENRNFVRGARGKTYEVLTWKPGRNVSSDAVREHFRPRGFTGNTAAFISWVAEKHPKGWYASIPEDEQRFAVGGGLYAPGFHRVDSDRKLDLCRLAGDWDDDYVFVAFREIEK